MRSSIVSLASLALLLAACDSATDSGKAGPPARLDIVSGDAQQAVAGEELPQPLVVKVLDAKGKPVKGQIVNFRVVSGGGSVFAGAAATNDDGIAQERWTLGKVIADSQRVEARAVDATTGAGLVFGTFRATGLAGTAAGVRLVGDSAFTAPLGANVDSIAARVVDANGNPVAGAQVSWVATAGGGGVPAATTSNAAGIAKARWTLGTVVDSLQRAEARVGNAAVRYQAATTVTLSQLYITYTGAGQTGTAGTTMPQPLVVRVQTTDARPVRGIRVDVGVNGYGYTDAQGYATLALRFRNHAGAYQEPLSLATAKGSISDITLLNFTSLAAQPARLQLARPTFWLAGAGVPSGTSYTIRFTLLDRFGNPATGAAVPWQITAGNGTLSAPQSQADSLGVVKVTFTTGSAAYHEIEATIPGIGTRLFFVGTSPHTYTARIIPASPDTFRIALGQELDLTLEVRDETGAVYPNTPDLLFGWGHTSTPGGVLAYSGFLGSAQQYWGQAPGTARITVDRVGTSCATGNCPPDDIPYVATPPRIVVVQ